VQKVYKFIALALFLLIILFLLIGFLSGYETAFAVSETIDSPKNTTWKRVVDYGEFSKWLFPGARITLSKALPLERNSMLNIYPSNGSKTISTEYKILEFIPDKKIALRNIGKTQLPVINDQIITIELQSLRDGSSEIIWRESYRVKTFFSKIYNTLLYKNNRAAKAKRALRQLKRLIENY
jgi:hypothetical protein